MPFGADIISAGKTDTSIFGSKPNSRVRRCQEGLI